MADEKPKEKYREMKAQVTVPYEMAMGRNWHRFFENLKEERIMGTRCGKCSRVFVPPRSFCPRCFEDNEEWVEVGQQGTIETWCYSNLMFYGQTLKPPFIAVQVHLDGTDVGLQHRIAGFDLSDFETVRKRVKSGGRVRVVWSREKKGNIFDIDYFELIPE
ncbi:MAG: Zn-ribbon domain-containing OB-fold protein [Syntrophaceae bacterium]|nr:Zn-ribbon domain-containing OB-fold protein [Syntrophaceae bacterium]